MGRRGPKPRLDPEDVLEHLLGIYPHCTDARLIAVGLGLSVHNADICAINRALRTLEREGRARCMGVRDGRAYLWAAVVRD